MNFGFNNKYIIEWNNAFIFIVFYIYTIFNSIQFSNEYFMHNY